MKTPFYVTESAGPAVAGLKSPGADGEVLLTEAQAEHPLRLGHIRRTKEAPKGRDPLDHDGNGRKGGSVARKKAPADE